MLARAKLFVINSRPTLHILTLSQSIRLTTLTVVLSLSACQSASEKISGTYETSLATAAGPEAVKLLLNKDHTAELYSNYADSGGMIVQRGSWKRSGRDSLTVFLVEREGRMFLDTLGLSMEGSRLLLKGSEFGSGGVSLVRKTR